MVPFRAPGTMQDFCEVHTWRGRFPSCRPPHQQRESESLRKTQRDRSSRKLTRSGGRRDPTIDEVAHYTEVRAMTIAPPIWARRLPGGDSRHVPRIPVLNFLVFSGVGPDAPNDKIPNLVQFTCVWNVF